MKATDRLRLIDHFIKLGYDKALTHSNCNPFKQQFKSQKNESVDPVLNPLA